MNLFNRPILPFFVTAIFLGLFLVGCLDAPDYPQALQPVKSIRIMVKQKGNTYSDHLKVNPSDSATIKAEVDPDKYQNDLIFEWFNSNETKDSLLTRGTHYTFYPTKSRKSIPNKLIVTDGEGNQQTQDFDIVINSVPVISDSTIPADGDTLYGSTTSAFLFVWYSMDMDLLNNDTLFHILDIDGKEYDVGTLQEVKQSGFKPGKHMFRIIVRDIYGDTASLSYKKFYVVDTLEAK